MSRLRRHRLCAGILLAITTCEAVVFADAAATTAYAGADVCAGCHQTEHEEWQTSKHAGAFSETFQSYWKSLGSAPECLACHTTGFDPQTRGYAFPGVSCESCHGPLKAGHPGDETMGLAAESEVCMSCHQQTYREWKLSGHAARNIRCFDCHAVHRQGLRLADGEQQCGACHAQRMEDFAHATHHAHGLTCTTCHMPQPRSPGIGGTGAPGHNFSVGAETCAGCHDEMVHSSHKLGTLAAEVDRLAHEANVQHAEALQARVRQLEQEADAARSRTLRWSVLALLLGLVVGAALIAISRRGNGGRARP